MFRFALSTIVLLAVSRLNGSVAESISQQKCKEYSKVFDTCSARRIPEGKMANLGEFPYLAALKYDDSSKTRYLCVGALISKNYVIAPAYCVTTSRGRPESVRLGDLSTLDENLGPFGQEIKVTGVKIHPRYNPQTQAHVLALLKLEKDVVFNKHVHPICLSDKDIAADSVLASGWNFFSRKTEEYGQLLKSVFSVYKHDECDKLYSRKKNITEEHLCAGLRKHDCGTQPSGTVEMQNEDLPCMHSLVGLVNYGPTQCTPDGIPDVYTKTAPSISWIESIIWA